MLKSEQSIAVELSTMEQRGVEALCTLEHIDRPKLIQELVEEGLRERLTRLYDEGKLTAGRAAEILGITPKEFMQLLDNKGILLKWDYESISEYLNELTPLQENP